MISLHNRASKRSVPAFERCPSELGPFRCNLGDRHAENHQSYVTSPIGAVQINCTWTQDTDERERELALVLPMLLARALH